MSSEQKFTVWQRLSRALGPDALLNQDFPTYKFDRKELLRTTDKAEYEKEKLQARQSFYLSNQFDLPIIIIKKLESIIGLRPNLQLKLKGKR